jgi:DNA polymerase III epsilon subunit-like protein
MILSQETIFWFDSETTGFDENKHQMISFAIVATDENFNVKDTFYKFIKLNGVSEITEQAMQINKIDFNSKEYTEGALTESQLITEASAFILKHKTQYSVAIAHNNAFDSRFYYATTLRTNLDNVLAQLKNLCTVKFFKKLVSMGLINTKEILDKNDKLYKSAKLEHITEALKIQHNAHNALGDTLGLIESYRQGIKLLKNQDHFDIHDKDSNQ